MYKAMFPCDLHTHTKRSDGNDSCREIIEYASAAGVEILALTDHDIIAPETIAINGHAVKLTDYAKSQNVTLLRGIEFSCDTAVDDVHIVALGCDFNLPFFEREYQNSVRSKIDGYRELCGLLAQDGMIIDWRIDILLDGQRKENAVQRKHIFEAMAQKGYVAEWSDAKLFVNQKKRYSVRRKKPDPADVIQNIRKSGGIAILAHPHLIGEAVSQGGKPVPRAQYIDNLIHAGLDGIEASYPYDKTSYSGNLTADRIEAEVRRLYGDRVSILSGGSDYHNEGMKGSKNPRMLGEKGVSREYFMNHPLLRGLLQKQ